MVTTCLSGGHVVKSPDIDTVWQWLDQVPDPEIPVISLVDLGIVRDVAYQGDRLRITLSPTYSGCPATRVIEEDVRTAMRDHGIEQVIINQQISPPWTTDWMSDKGKAKLQDYGINKEDIKVVDAPDNPEVGQVVVEIWPHELVIARIRTVRGESFISGTELNIELKTDESGKYID